MSSINRAIWAIVDFLQTYNGAVTAVATIVIAAFTTILGIFTVSLARSTRRAAEAAKISADTLPVVERAYVYPIIIGHGAINDCVMNALVFFLGDTTKYDLPAPETAELTFKFKNFGNTPAILKTAFVGFGVDPLGAEIGLSIPEAVLGVLEETNPLKTRMQIGITGNQAQHILAYTGHICFSGKITFDDIWGNEHTTRFYFAWDKDIQRMALRWVETKTKTKQKGESERL